MNPNKAIIGLGSNIRPVINMAFAVEQIKKHFTIISVSSFGSTTPIGIIDQPDFLNGAVLVNTQLPIFDVQNLLKKIEDDMGRDRTTPKFGPRIIDLDLIMWNGQIIDNDYYTRPFIQEAVAELNNQ